MNRAELVEKARIAILNRRGPGKHPGLALDAAAVVDALLPQVTTVEELRHLLIRVSQEASPAVVIDNLGRTWTLFENDRGDWWAQRLGDQDEPESVSTMLNLDEDFDGDDLDAEPWHWLLPGPLTIVWSLS